MNRWKYTLDARYNMGLKEIMATENAMDFVENAKHRVTNISIGISYFVFGRANKMINTTKEAGKYF